MCNGGTNNNKKKLYKKLITLRNQAYASATQTSPKCPFYLFQMNILLYLYQFNNLWMLFKVFI